MTEQKWLSSNDPARMLAFLRGSNPLIDECPTPPSDRKLRLFACACCLLSGRSRERVDVWEQVGQDLFYSDSSWAENWANTVTQGGEPSSSIRAALLRDIFGNPFRPWMREDAFVAGAPLLGRNINIVWASWLTWNDRTIPRLAQQIYDSQDFSLMPVLADALEEAGCTNKEILMHCRGMARIPIKHVRNNGECFIALEWQASDAHHVRGCWVIDLLLGKE